MLWLVRIPAAFTDTRGPYGSNYPPMAAVVQGPGAPFDLETGLRTGVGADPRPVWPILETEARTVMPWVERDPRAPVPNWPEELMGAR